jgi:hypothetical protein
MKKSVVVLAVAVMLLGSMSVAFAEASWSPAKTFGEMKGMTEQEAYEYRNEQNKWFGELAQAEGEEFYVEFSKEILEAKKAMLKEMVGLGKLTQERADEILAKLEACDGTQMRVMQGTGLFGNRDGDGSRGGFGGQKGQGQGGMMRRGAWNSN